MKSARSKGANMHKTPSKNKLNSDPVQVFCRIRPMDMEFEVSCMRLLSPNAVLLTPPDSNGYKAANSRAMSYTFQEVFSNESTQNEVFTKVASPLVEHLIRGKSGLLFTYGVTGSGKTFTMTGEPSNTGILPRCLDMIFKTIANCQARKYVFKPDKMNMFDIHTEAEAMLERQQELFKIKSTKKNNSCPDLAVSNNEINKVDGINDDNQYAVFVTYTEIYNNSVYDLLDETNRPLQMKIIREDASRNMYVHGVTELEIKSPEEAFDVFHRGMKRKRVAHTTLNAESSRSHSVFTIRLVQAPVDDLGEAVVQDKKAVCISQLSLVDLAGSERTNRTKNTGQRLREAGNINNSLMTLRSCLEVLRENQLSGASKIVPYRESKVTHLFKNFFDGEGLVKMVVCVNPRADDYDENLQVMRFAEVAREVEVARPTCVELGVGMTPGRRKANQLYKMAQAKMAEDGRPEAQKLEVDLGLVYSLGPDFPSLELNSSAADHIIKELIAHMEMRIDKRLFYRRHKGVKDEQFRTRLLDLEKEATMREAECASLQAVVKQERKRTKLLEERIVEMESAKGMLQRKLDAATKDMSNMKTELEQKQMQLAQYSLEKEKQKRKFTHKIMSEQEKMSRELDNKLKQQRNKLKSTMKVNENKIRLVKQIVAGMAEGGSGDSTTVSVPGSEEGAEAVAEPRVPTLTDITNTPRSHTQPNTASKRGVAVSNPRHRRSLSADGRAWLEHKPSPLVPLGTVLKPLITNSKAVTKLTSVKDIANSKTSKYCLVSQEQDTDGELETRLYKGDVVPTCGGGAQVIFNDVEMLKQTSAARLVSPTRHTHTPTHTPASSCARHSAKRRDSHEASDPPISVQSSVSKKPRI